MTHRDLEVLAKSAEADALKRRQNEAFERLKKAEKVARVAAGGPSLTREKAKQGLRDAIALCEEFGALGRAC